MMMKVIVALLLLAAAPIQALDVILKDFECDETLPIYATELMLSCENSYKSNRCTFGDSATLSGNLVYKGLEEAGVQNNKVYGTSDLNFLTLTYHLIKNLPLYLCHAWVQRVGYYNAEAQEEDAGDERRRRHLGDEDNYNDNGDENCGIDGNYTFSATYQLPGGSEDSTDWVTTGWVGSGEISLYAEKQNVDTLVGYCTMDLTTAVTKTSGIVNAPSAVTTLIIFGVAMGVAALTCLYCACCRRNRSRQINAEGGTKSLMGKTVTTRKYEDDTIMSSRSRDDGTIPATIA